MRGLLGSGARTIGSRGSRLCALRASFDAFAPLPEGAFTGVSHGAGPAAAEAEQRLALGGIASGSVGGNGDGRVLSPSPPIRFGGRSPGSEAVTSPRGTDSAFLFSLSEEDECESTKAPPPVSPQYEELLEVMTHAVAKLK